MRNITDEHLEFLNTCTAEELDPLLDVILDKDRSGRISSELDTSEEYKKYSPDHTKYTSEIVREIQKYGGNTVMNIFRGGEGVPYKEVLCDVCDHLKVNFNKRQSLKLIEEALLSKVLQQVWEEMSEEERAKVLEDVDYETHSAGGVTSATMIALFRAGGFTSYKIVLIIINAIWKLLFGRGLSLAANATIARTASIFAGPIGWAIAGVWTAFDIASPALRVTIPACIYIAGLRRMKETKVLNSNTPNGFPQEEID
jgi:uncharacterized protein YaaW (UPF0174 family)